MKRQIWTEEDWLEAATHNLAIQELPRLQEEIRQHYRDALAKYQAEGMVYLEAQKLALADLGDARKANIYYCKHYLTQGDMKNLMANMPTSAISIVWAILNMFAVGSILKALGGFDLVFQWATVLGMLVVSNIVQVYLVNKASIELRYRVAVLLSMGQSMTLYANMVTSSMASIEAVMILSLLPIFGVILRRSLPLYFKLLRRAYA
jgi:hypothetical protein